MISFVIAMRQEADIIISQMKVINKFSLGYREVYEGNVCGKDIGLIVCGVGKVNAAIATQYMIDKYQPTVVINIGVAGGLDNDMKIGDTFIINAVTQFDFDLSHINKDYSLGRLDEWDNSLMKLDHSNYDKLAKLETKVLGSGDRFSDSKLDFARLKKLGANIRDMEGAAIGQTCILNNIPLLIIKSISDVYGKNTTTQYWKNKNKAIESLRQVMFEKVIKII